MCIKHSLLFSLWVQQCEHAVPKHMDYFVHYGLVVTNPSLMGLSFLYLAHKVRQRFQIKAMNDCW
ncbi:predicted protein [Sclerotinia sclerotiorum 1980 UF-70]|uniref:Uncharacterized protein n=1 Tax=Sclerotinia sclerotiorum (strain ATCC 18683 / 1980 / Ss-1) TaxID=665079 RepID=A7EEA3_SCLS1|nr:predicted protein [Sclerotinia sclerotiorum 1980 UF-70]EDO01169.1 predicted protein [Sclerotinia sclerotiorum 1980 UF-70]